VAAGTGRHLLGDDAAAVDALAQRQRLLVACGAFHRLLAAIKGRDVLHVFFRQGRGHPGHDGVLALAALELRQLLDDVLGMLALQDGIGGQAAAAIGRVAGDARGSQLLALGHISLEGRLGLRGGSSAGEKRQAGRQGE
jgi:hypothetical protein